MRAAYATVRDVVVTFFAKPGIWLLLLFIFLYRAGEGQVIRIGPLFLVDPVSAGGLGLTTEQFGTIYGTFGTIAFITGSILGGIKLTPKMFLEAKLGLGDVPDAKFMVGWNLR